MSCVYQPLEIMGSNGKEAEVETEPWVLVQLFIIDKTPSAIFPGIYKSQGRFWYPGNWAQELEPHSNRTTLGAETWKGSHTSIQRKKQVFKSQRWHLRVGWEILGTAQCALSIGPTSCYSLGPNHQDSPMVTNSFRLKVGSQSQRGT